MPPKLCFSCSSFFTSMTCGKPSMPLTNGYSTGVPMARANAMNCAGSSCWLRKKMTWCSRKAARISFSGKFLERSTPRISAPRAPAMRRTSTLERSRVGTAVHQQILPRNEAGLGAAEIGAGIAELLGAAEAASGIGIGAHLAQLGGGLAGFLGVEFQVGTQPVGLERARQQVVDGDVV